MHISTWHQTLKRTGNANHQKYKISFSVRHIVCRSRERQRTVCPLSERRGKLGIVNMLPWDRAALCWPDPQPGYERSIGVGHSQRLPLTFQSDWAFVTWSHISGNHVYKTREWKIWRRWIVVSSFSSDVDAITMQRQRSSPTILVHLRKKHSLDYQTVADLLVRKTYCELSNGSNYRSGERYIL